jgi:hypothetical protein
VRYARCILFKKGLLFLNLSAIFDCIIIIIIIFFFN